MSAMEIKKYSLYKNSIHLYDFNTIKDCGIWLENIIGGSLYEGLRGLRELLASVGSHLPATPTGVAACNENQQD